jgi:uncharacterized membrane protein YcaP (DUF421 family)
MCWRTQVSAAAECGRLHPLGSRFIARLMESPTRNTTDPMRIVLTRWRRGSGFAPSRIRNTQAFRRVSSSQRHAEPAVDSTVVPFDLQRMLVGDHTLLFGFEVILRTVIVYLYALVLLRWLGSRTIGQLSTVEFLLVIALGSAVGDAMFYPDVPLLHALIVVTVVVFANKGLDILIARSKRAERLIDGSPVEIIVDGVFRKKFLDGTSLGTSEVFQQLRRRHIEHLGQVRYAFAEPDGEVTVFSREDDVPPGLPIVPPWEIHPPVTIKADEIVARTESLACMRCGTVTNVAARQSAGTCPNCGRKEWTPATTGTSVRRGKLALSPRPSAASGRPMSASRN